MPLPVVILKQTWFFILLILFHNSKYIPQEPFVRVISTTWETCLSQPFNKLPHKGKLGVGWGAVIVLFFGATFGIKSTEDSPFKYRAISLVGMVVLYGGVYLFSAKRRHVSARPVVLGLCLQMILGLFVFKTQAGLDLFTWVALACSDFLEQGITGGATFFWRDFVS